MTCLRVRVWVGTSDSGLFLYDLEHNLLSPLLSHSFPKQPVQTFVANTDTTVMVGIDGQGIWELNNDGTGFNHLQGES